MKETREGNVPSAGAFLRGRPFRFRIETMMTIRSVPMVVRQGFGKPARRFTMTVSTQEGYQGGTTHERSLVMKVIRFFAQTEKVEFGGELLPSTVFYSYFDSGVLKFHEEDGVQLTGLFPPNKFGEHTDEQLVEMLGKLASYLAGTLGQVSIHAEICGNHYSWKREGEVTAHESAQNLSS